MADVNTITPIAQIQFVAAIGQQNLAAGETETLLKALAALPVVEGTIAGKDSNGNYILKTDQGNLALKSDVPLTYNSDVVIRILPNNQQNQARIISVNGESFASFSAPPPATGDSVGNSQTNTQTTTSTKSLPQDNITVSNNSLANSSNVVRAIVVATPAKSLTVGNEVVVHLPEQIPQSTQAEVPANVPLSETNIPAQAVQQTTTANQVVVLPENLPQPPPPQQISIPREAQPQTTLPQNNVQAANAPAIPTNNPPIPLANIVIGEQQQPTNTPNNQQNTTPPQQQNQPQNTNYAAYTKPILVPTPAITAQVNTSNILQGKVISVAENGNVNIQTPVGVVTVKPSQNAPLLVGEQVAIELPNTTTTTQTQSPVPQSFNEIAKTWSSLNEIINIVQEKNQSSSTSTTNLPQLDKSSSANSQPVNNFVNSSLKLINSLITGNAKEVLGESTVNNLQQSSHTDLIQKFSQELTNIANNFNAPTTNNEPKWQTIIMPFMFQDSLQQARISVKDDSKKNKNSADKSSGGVRFVVEVDLSELGGVQMDGLVRKQQSNTVFDLMLRTNTTFSSADQAEITSIYNNIAAQTGFTGTIAFQTTKDFPVKPLDAVNTSNIITA